MIFYILLALIIIKLIFKYVLAITMEGGCGMILYILIIILLIKIIIKI